VDSPAMSCVSRAWARMLADRKEVLACAAMSVVVNDKTRAVAVDLDPHCLPCGSEPHAVAKHRSIAEARFNLGTLGEDAPSEIQIGLGFRVVCRCLATENAGIAVWVVVKQQQRGPVSSVKKLVDARICDHDQLPTDGVSASDEVHSGVYAAPGAGPWTVRASSRGGVVVLRTVGATGSCRCRLPVSL
jgi:hypothetical protein